MDNQTPTNIGTETPANPEATPASTATAKQNKPSWAGKKWLVIGVVIALIIAGGGTFVLSQQKKNEPSVKVTKKPTVTQPSPTPNDPPADWKTYTNEDKTFLFKYPPGMTLAKGPIDKLTGKLEVTGGHINFGTLISQTEPFPIPQVNQQILIDSLQIKISSLTRSEKTIGDKKVEKYVISCEGADCYMELINFSNGNKFYQMQFNIAGGGLSGIVDLILQTFKFTDPSITPAAILNQAPATKPNMKIYPTTHDFTFQYPDYFILNSTSTSSTISFLQQQNDIKAQRLLVDITQTTQSLEDFAKTQTYVKSDDFPLIEEPQVIDGHQAIAFTKSFSMQDMCHSGSSDKMKRTSLFLIKGTDSISAFVVNDSCYTVENDWFSQIPPTIKFTK